MSEEVIRAMGRLNTSKVSLEYTVAKVKKMYDDCIRRLIQLPYKDTEAILGCKAELTVIVKLQNDIALDVRSAEGDVEEAQENEKLDKDIPPPTNGR